jgi:hypothetical protein
LGRGRPGGHRLGLDVSRRLFVDQQPEVAQLRRVPRRHLVGHFWSLLVLALATLVSSRWREADITQSG